MDRRAAFFALAAVVCLAVSPATESAIRWIPIAMAVAYVVLAGLSFLDAWSRHHDHKS
jgi:biotin transporter BioY